MKATFQTQCPSSFTDNIQCSFSFLSKYDFVHVIKLDVLDVWF